MEVLRVRNVHAALPEAVRMIKLFGRKVETRNGPALRYPEPVCTVYTNPRERVLFWPQRDANPFFHFFEALWMMNGQQDVATLTRYVKRMANFSDDGYVFHGAYGYRWRQHFKYDPYTGGNYALDQLRLIAERLRNDPEDRRQVLQIWDCQADLQMQEGKRDLPCNLVATFSMDMGALDMMVFNRSNDIIWGAYGANAVHFSFLQDVMASLVGCPVGVYRHVSNNWHAYVDTLKKVEELEQHAAQPAYASDQPSNPYPEFCTPFSIVNTDPATWFQDLAMFMSEGARATGYRDIFFRRVAVPMLLAHDYYKDTARPSNYHAALDACTDIAASDWRMACEQWLERRLSRWEARR